MHYLTFAFALGLCWLVLRRFGETPGYEVALPAFFSFLPIVFLFLCGEIHGLHKQIDKLKKALDDKK